MEFNWPENKIKVIVNPFSASLQASGRLIIGSYLLFFGRLSRLLTLIEAATKTQSHQNLPGVGKSVNGSSEKQNVKAEFF